MPVVECAWCKKEKIIASSKAKKYKFYFCNADCKAKWGIFNSYPQASHKTYVSDTLRSIIRDLISDYFRVNGKPKFLSKPTLNPEIIEKVKTNPNCPKYSDRRIKGTVSVILKSDFGYALPVGTTTESNTLVLSNAV